MSNEPQAAQENTNAAAASVTATPVQAQEPKATEQTAAAPVTQETKPEAKDATTPAPQPVVPEKYDLKVPENTYLEGDVIQKIEAVAKANGLSNEQAQALLDQQHKEVAEFVTKRSETWKQACMSDSEIGGEKLAEVAELSKRVLSQFGSPKLLGEIEKMGFGNHPEFLRFTAKLGKAMANDLVIPSGASSGPQDKPAHDYFYKS